MKGLAGHAFLFAGSPIIVAIVLLAVVPASAQLGATPADVEPGRHDVWSAHLQTASQALKKGALRKAETEIRLATREAYRFADYDQRHNRMRVAIEALVRAYNQRRQPERVTALLQGLDELADANPKASATLRIYVISSLAEFLAREGDLARSETTYRQLLRFCTDRFGSEHPHCIEAVIHLAGNLTRRGQFGEAERLTRQALAAAEDSLGPRSRVVSRALQMLAGIEVNRGDARTAVEHLERSLAIVETRSEGLTLEVANILLALAAAKLRVAEAVEAQTLLDRARIVFEATWGQRPRPLPVAGPIAQLHLLRGELGDARSVAEEALATAIAHHGIDSQGTAVYLLVLARVSEILGGVEEARALLNRARPFVEERLKRPGFGGMDAVRNHGILEARIGDPGRGERYLTDSLRRAETFHGERSVAVARELAALATIQNEAGDYDDAATSAERALGIVSEAGDLRSFAYLEVMSSLGVARAGQGRLPEAVSHLETAAAQLEAALGPDSPELAEVLEHLAVSLRGVGNTERASEIDARLAAASKRRSDSLASVVPKLAVIELTKLNFRLARPAPPWTEIDPRRLNSSAPVAFVRGGPEIYFVANPERMSVERDYEPDELVMLAEQGFRNRGAEILEIQSRAQKLAGTSGVRVEMLILEEGLKFRHDLWLAAHKGYYYRLRSWANASDVSRDALARNTDKILAGFSVIDPDRIASLGGALVGRFESKSFPYAVDLSGTYWTRMDSVEDRVPGAELSARLRGRALFGVIPVSLLGTRLFAPRVFEGLAEFVRIPTQSVAEPVEMTEFEGQQFEFEREIAGVPYRFRVLMLAGPREAYAGFAGGPAQWDDIEEVLQTLERIEIDRQGSSTLTVDAMTPMERKRHASFFNRIALSYSGLGQYGVATQHLDLAQRLVPEDRQLLQNLIEVQIAAGRFAETVELVEETAARFPEDARLIGYGAFARSKNDDLDGAIQDYERAFSMGLEQPDLFQHFIQTLWAAGRRNAAFAALDSRIAEAPSSDLRLIRASLQRQSGNFDAALAELLELETARFANAETLAEIILVYFEAGEYRNALAACEKYTERIGVLADVLLLQARAQYNLGWYREARSSLEEAEKLQPGSTEIRDFLASLAGTVGEGDTTLLREPIAPVDLPAGLAANDATAPDPGVYGSYYSAWIEGFHYEPGVMLRRTTRIHATVTGAAGLDQLGSLALMFDPLSERVFVNEVIVRDESGVEVGRGKREDYYVLDRGGDIASSLKTVHIPVPGLAIGGSLEVVFTREQAAPPKSFNFFEHTFSRTVPVLQSTVFVTGDVASIRASFSESVEVSEVDSARVWRVHGPEPYRWEPLQPGDLRYLPWVQLGDAGDSWERVARSYHEELASILAVSPAIESIAQERAHSDGDPQGTRELASFVRDHLHYKAVAFGKRARIPEDVGRTLERRYGDCKDHSVLLHQMLGEAGMEVHVALVRAGGWVNPDVPSLDQFDHMIVFCADCEGMKFLDATDKEMLTGLDAPRGLGGKLALIIDPETPRLVRIPEFRAEPHEATIERKIQILGDGSISVGEEVVLQGQMAAGFRSAFHTRDKSTWKEALQSELFGGLHGAAVKSLEVEGLDDVEQPLRVAIAFEVNSVFAASGEELVGRVPASWERALLAVSATEKRHTPFELPHPIALSVHVRLLPPLGYTIQRAVGDFEAGSGPFLKWAGDAKPEESGLVLDYTVSRSAGRYSADAYADFYQESRQAISFFDQAISVRKQSDL